MNSLIKHIHISDKIEITDTGINIKDELSEIEWFNAIEYCNNAKEKIHWVIGELLIYGAKKKYRKYEEMMGKTNYKYQRLADIKYVTQNVEVSLRNETLSFSHHKEVAKLDEEKQKHFLDKAEEEKLSVRDLRKEIQEEKFNELKVDKEITGKYDVIVIDPPWHMEKIRREVAPNQVGFDYPTMTIDEIKDFQLPNTENCHLFLWTTHKHLPHAFDILEYWKFKYVCCFVWHKTGGFQPFNLPQYNCEFVLYARIGTPQFTETKSFFTCFDGKRTGHSKKPDEFYETIKRVTSGKRIDVFNRRSIEGFDTWGNEAGD